MQEHGTLQGLYVFKGCVVETNPRCPLHDVDDGNVYYDAIEVKTHSHHACLGCLPALPDEDGYARLTDAQCEYNPDVFFQTLFSYVESVVGHLHKAVTIELIAWRCNIDHGVVRLAVFFQIPMSLVITRPSRRFTVSAATMRYCYMRNEKQFNNKVDLPSQGNCIHLYTCTMANLGGN